MTLTELRDFIRLQINEVNAAFWSDTDLDSYITLAAQRFARRVYPIIFKESFTIDNTKYAEEEVSEVFDITCVADLTSTTGTIGGEYFKIYDNDDTEYLVWYDVGGLSTAPTGDNLIEVDIAADAPANTVANATSAAIAATAGFSATVDSNVVTVTVDAGYITTDADNVNVDNGTDELSISITTAGLNEYFELTYKMAKDRSAILLDADADRTPMTRVAYSDWIRHSDDDRGTYKIYFLDETYPNRVYFPISLDGGTVFLEYFPKIETANVSTFLANDFIPEEYHEVLAKYAISLAFRRDNKLTESRDYLQQYIYDENEARIEFSEKRAHAYNDDFSLDITNPHRDESLLFNNGMTL